MLEPEPRPSKDCGMCKNFDYFGFKKCECACHRVGNLLRGFHEHFNSLDYELPKTYIPKYHGTKFG